MNKQHVILLVLVSKAKLHIGRSLECGLQLAGFREVSMCHIVHLIPVCDGPDGKVVVYSYLARQSMVQFKDKSLMSKLVLPFWALQLFLELPWLWLLDEGPQPKKSHHQTDLHSPGPHPSDKIVCFSIAIFSNAQAMFIYVHILAT